jgi:hypothetical protein
MQIDSSSAPTVPTGQAPTPNPGTINSGRDLAAERDSELKRNEAAAKAKADRFTVRHPAAVYKPAVSAAPEYETLLLKGAVNHPLADAVYPAISTYTPNMTAFFYILHIMDHLMCSTKRWYDNSFGWAPPISQMYFSVLIYYQIMKAMHAAGNASGEMIQFIITFEQLFSTSELWIPGPLVAAFRALSAFRPDANDLFGGVTVHIPNNPGHTRANTYTLQHQLEYLLPNINHFISRLRRISAAAVATTTDAEFASRTDGPLYVDNYCHTAAAQHFTTSPGSRFSYGGTRLLWVNASNYLDILGIPVELNATVNAAPNNVPDTWTSVLRFENNEHTWFGNVSATMAKYSQFFNGSVPLSEISPTSSAAGALKLRLTAATDIWNAVPAHAFAGTGTSHVHGNANAIAHLAMVNQIRIVTDAQCAIRDIPDAHVFSGLTFNYNAYNANAMQAAHRHGAFWQLGPNVKQSVGIEILPSLASIIMRDYHNDTRIPAFKQ